MGQKKLVTKESNEIEGVQSTPVSVPTETRPGAGPSSSKKPSKKQVINGVAHISVSYNNTMIAITDTKGELLAWSSSGALGFKGNKKSTPYAANLVAKNATEKAKKYNLINLKIMVKGVGPGRESAIRGLAASGLTITALMDKTPIAHNGVKAKKPRRV